ncbi:hypothetical protein [Lentilactobacillus rapi]|uniref:hypothetical protein n=1 Tax=Lentilactobacillus rapi TaxID=481723 RepID=UPI000AB9DDD6|nr:hypothetical protein [Lentilactobacillus rapi]
MNTTYFKATLREITYSWGKFISIVLIILLGSLLYVGIRATGPDLDNSAARYFNQHNLGDLTVTSTLGLTGKDLRLIKNAPHVATAEANHMVVTKKSQDEVVSVSSFSQSTKLNRLKLVSGHLPRSRDQIVLDSKAKQRGYKLGQAYRVPKTAGLRQQTYKIVGFVNSPLFVSSTDRGTTNLGSGEIDYFAYLPKQAFNQSTYGSIAVKFNNTAGLAAGTDKYNERVQSDQAQLEKRLKQRPEQRQKEIVQPQLATINSKLNQLDKQTSQLSQVPAAYQTTQMKTLLTS